MESYEDNENYEYKESDYLAAIKPQIWAAMSDHARYQIYVSLFRRYKAVDKEFQNFKEANRRILKKLEEEKQRIEEEQMNDFRQAILEQRGEFSYGYEVPKFKLKWMKMEKEEEEDIKYKDVKEDPPKMVKKKVEPMPEERRKYFQNVFDQTFKKELIGLKRERKEEEKREKIKINYEEAKERIKQKVDKIMENLNKKRKNQKEEGNKPKQIDEKEKMTKKIKALMEDIEKDKEKQFEIIDKEYNKNILDYGFKEAVARKQEEFRKMGIYSFNPDELKEHEEIENALKEVEKMKAVQENKIYNYEHGIEYDEDEEILMYKSRPDSNLFRKPEEELTEEEKKYVNKVKKYRTEFPKFSNDKVLQIDKEREEYAKKTIKEDEEKDPDFLKKKYQKMIKLKEKYNLPEEKVNETINRFEVISRKQMLDKDARIRNKITDEKEMLNKIRTNFLVFKKKAKISTVINQINKNQKTDIKKMLRKMEENGEVKLGNMYVIPNLEKIKEMFDKEKKI